VRFVFAVISRRTFWDIYPDDVHARTFSFYQSYV
jgi:hypothetical protein